MNVETVDCCCRLCLFPDRGIPHMSFCIQSGHSYPFDIVNDSVIPNFDKILNATALSKDGETACPSFLYADSHRPGFSKFRQDFDCYGFY